MDKKTKIKSNQIKHLRIQNSIEKLRTTKNLYTPSNNALVSQNHIRLYTSYKLANRISIIHIMHSSKRQFIRLLISISTRKHFTKIRITIQKALATSSSSSSLTNYELRFTIYDIRFMIHDIWSTIYDIYFILTNQENKRRNLWDIGLVKPKYLFGYLFHVFSHSCIGEYSKRRRRIHPVHTYKVMYRGRRRRRRRRTHVLDHTKGRVGTIPIGSLGFLEVFSPRAYPSRVG